MSSDWSRVFSTVALVGSLQGSLLAQGAGAPTTPRTPMTGSDVYNRGCVSCHGPEGQGVPPSNGGIEVPDFSNCKFAQGPFTVEAELLYQSIAFGGPATWIRIAPPSPSDS